MEPQPPGQLTVLQAPRKHLTKSYERDRNGRIHKTAYDKATLFHSRPHRIETVDELEDLLRWLQRHPDCCVIQAAAGRWHPGAGWLVRRRIYAALELVDGQGRWHKPARKGAAEAWQQQRIEAGLLNWATALPMFEERPTRILLLDFDKAMMPAGVEWRADLSYTAAFLRRTLPIEFHDAKCCYYATSSAADPTKPDFGGQEIKMRLGFVLERGVTSAQAKRWLADVEGLDRSTLNPAQPIYTAAPRYLDGLVDPLPERQGLLAGSLELVPVPEIRTEQRLRREKFIGLGPVRSAEGLGLLKPHPRLDAALGWLHAAEGGAGEVRTALLQAAFAYVQDVGRDHVDIDALADALADAAASYRTADEIAGYGLKNLIAWCLERAPDDPPSRPHYPEVGLPAEEASTKLRAEMATAVGAAVAWRATATEDEAPPMIGFKAGAGIGKTGCALEQIAAVPGVDQLNVEIYVPTQVLAKELADRVRALDVARRATSAVAIDLIPELRVRVIRGRGAKDIDGEALCAKAELAEAIGRSGLNVMGHLCRRKGENGQPDQLCEFAGKCRYLAQFRDDAPAIRVLAHAAMHVCRNQELPDPDLVVIDEAFWRDAVVHQRLAVDRLAEAGRWRARRRKVKKPGPNATPEEVAAAAFASVKARRQAHDRVLEAEDFANRVRNALLEGRDPRCVVTAEEAEIVAGVEWDSRGGPNITPDMPYRQQRSTWASWQNDECAKAARFWELLAEEYRHPARPLQRIILERDAPTKDGDRRHLLHLHYRRPLRLPSVPVILLDADLDRMIAEKFLPGIGVVEIPVRHQAEVTQVVDRSCSMRFLLGGGEGDEQRAANRRSELQRTVSRLLAEGGLLVSYKGAIARMELPAAIVTLHLGNLRGRDGFKHLDRIVVAGRLEPSVLELERMTRAMFGEEAEPIRTVFPSGHDSTRYPTERRRYRMAGGTAGAAVDVSVHPDRRAQALLEQIRERELEQAVARLRLVYRARPATVWLLTNIPLNLEVSELTTWNALSRDRVAEACRRWVGVWLCSPGERAKAAPDLWPSQGAARQAERRKGYTESSRDYSIAVRTPFPVYPAWGCTRLDHEATTLVEYRRTGQRGSPHQAYVPGAVWCIEKARADLEAVTGPVASVALLGIMHRDRPGMVEAREEPALLSIPIVALVAAALPSITAVFTICGRSVVRSAPEGHQAERGHRPILIRPAGAAPSLGAEAAVNSRPHPQVSTVWLGLPSASGMSAENLGEGAQPRSSAGFWPPSQPSNQADGTSP